MDHMIRHVEELVETIQAYLNNRLDAIKISTAEKTSSLLATLAVVIILVLFLFTSLIFASIGFALFLNQYFEHRWIGFELVSGIYLLIALFIWLFKNKMIRLPILNGFIKLFIIDEHEDDKEQ